MTEVLMIEVQITTTSAMEREEGNVSLVCFTGSCHCRNFCGEIMEGGVDTQVGKSDGTVTLSARYLLDGADCDRKPCRIYVENNAIAKKDRLQDLPDVFSGVGGSLQTAVRLNGWKRQSCQER